MRSIIRRFPFLAYGSIALILILAIGTAQSELDLDYDDGELGTFLFGISLILDIIAFPYAMWRELLFALNDGRSFAGLAALQFSLGLATFALLDAGLAWHRRRRSRRLAV